MTSISDPAQPPPATTSRRGFLTRLGAVMVGGAAAGILVHQQAALATTNVFCCDHGAGHPPCLDVGIACPNPPRGNPCWSCATAQCKSYKCCDEKVADTSCVCAWYEGPFC
jgi:hypothetical protein